MLDAIDDERDSGRDKPIDIESLLTNVVPNFLVLSREFVPSVWSAFPLMFRMIAEFPFLQGRAFVFASQYARLLPAQLAGQYLDAAVQVLESAEAGIPVKVSAVKAIHK